jgi:hypothetical protein
MIRDEVEAVIVAWDEHEKRSGRPAVIDYDCRPERGERRNAADSRLSVLEDLTRLETRIESGPGHDMLGSSLRSHLQYLAAVLGSRQPLAEYVSRTQGFGPKGWSTEFVSGVGDHVRAKLERLGLDWGASLDKQMNEFEGELSSKDGADAIREQVALLEAPVRSYADTAAEFRLSIETIDVDAYWGYWLDGTGSDIRLRLNNRNARFTKVRSKQFALHEVLGHGLQGASFASRCASEDVPWLRLLSVHNPCQSLLEGLAQTLPLYICPDDEELEAVVLVDYYGQLVASELHLALETGESVADCADRARRRVPYWPDQRIERIMADRGVDPLLRTYMWAYAAGFDWFMALSGEEAELKQDIIRRCYTAPLRPVDLQAMWPEGPAFGGRA